MREVKLKEYLSQIADRLTEDSTLEDVYEQLSLLADIDESEEQIEKGEVLTQKEVEEKSKEWLK
jgi:predicted transcriptional regulator